MTSRFRRAKDVKTQLRRVLRNQTRSRAEPCPPSAIIMMEPSGACTIQRQDRQDIREGIDSQFCVPVIACPVASATKESRSSLEKSFVQRCWPFCILRALTTLNARLKRQTARCTLQGETQRLGKSCLNPPSGSPETRRNWLRRPCALKVDIKRKPPKFECVGDRSLAGTRCIAIRQH